MCDMARRWIVWLLLLTISMDVSAQVTEKLSATTKMFLMEYEQQKQAKTMKKAPAREDGALVDSRSLDRRPLLAAVESSNGLDFVSAFIRLDSSAVSKLLALGVVVESQFNGFVTARIPVERIEELSALEGVAEISVAEVSDVETDQARVTTGVQDALDYTQYARNLGLLHAYTGRGVVVGVIDSGIDFNHKAFKDKDGNSRIVKALAVARNSTGSTSEYDASEIASLTTDYDGSDHGTHTSSIAGGSTREENGVTYGGMAPEADLVLCGIGSNSTSTKIVNSVKYICDYADQVGKPCVINMSFGSQSGAHDGTGYLQEACNQLASPGHILVNSGGNDADHSEEGGMYLCGEASKSSPLQSVFNSHYYSNRDDSYYYNCYASAWARTENVPIGVRVFVINKNTNSVVWTSSEFTSRATITTSTRGSGSSTTFGKFYEILSGGYFDITVSQNTYNNKYQVLVDMSKVRSLGYEAVGDNFRTSNYAIGVSFYPTGSAANTYIDCWTNTGGYFTGSNVSGYHFVDGTNLCCSNDRAGTDSLILVGAYVTKKEIMDHNGKEWTISSYELGNYAPFSSYTVEGCGPTGRMEPTISAPGATIVSAVNHYSSAYTDDSNAKASGVRVNDDVNNPYGNKAGTSMAAPCVAGIVALWLQADPTLSVADVKQLLKETAIQDEFTQDEAGRPHFGNGKINALGGLHAILSRHQLLGDANQDGLVTFDDVAMLVNHILGKEVDTFSIENADVNGDGDITVADVTALVNTILSKPNRE